MKLYVRNLSYEATDDDLMELFGKFGTVTRAQVVVDRDRGQSRGFGFVSFLEDRDAETAMKMLTGTHHMGRKIHIEPSREPSAESITCAHHED